MKKILIISPHPDDAELAMGGTIAKMVSAGCEILIVDLTDGEPTPNGSIKTRLTESIQAAQILKVKRLCLNMPNRALEPTIKNRHILASQIRKFKPDIIFAPANPDYHPDHIAAAKITHFARFDAKLTKTNMPNTLHWTPLMFSYYSTHRHDTITPSFLVDITPHWPAKLKSILAYKSQISHISPSHKTPLPHRIKILNRYLGQLINTKYAEPFYAHQPITPSHLKLFA